MSDPLTKKKERKPLTKKEVQQITNQLTKNSIEVLWVTSNSDCMYDSGCDGVLCFNLIVVIYF